MSALRKTTDHDHRHDDTMKLSSLQKALHELQDISIFDNSFFESFCTFTQMLTNSEHCIIYSYQDEKLTILAGKPSDISYNNLTISETAQSLAYSGELSVNRKNNDDGYIARLSKILSGNDNAPCYILATETPNETPLAAALGQERFDLLSALFHQTLVNRQEPSNANLEIMQVLHGIGGIKRKTKALAELFANRNDADFVCIAPVIGNVIKTKSLGVSSDISHTLRTQIAIVMSEYIDDNNTGYFSAPVQDDTLARTNLIKTLGGSISIFQYISGDGSGCIILTNNTEQDLRNTDVISIGEGFCLIQKNRPVNRIERALGDLPLLSRLPKAYQLPALIMLSALFSLVPLPQTVKGKAFIVPTHQQVIAAPIAGRLETVLVEPGDFVEADQTLLATLDTNDLQAELDALKAKYASHLTEWRLSRSDGDAANARLAKLRANEISAQMKLTELRIEGSALKSPISGFVQGENQTQNIGANLSQGQELFRVVEKESKRVEFTIPVHDASKIDLESHQISIRTDIDPGKTYQLTNVDLYPVAEFVDGENVLRAVGVVSNQSQHEADHFLAGMQATYRVNAGYRPAILHLLGKPIRRARIFLGI